MNIQNKPVVAVRQYRGAEYRALLLHSGFQEEAATDDPFEATSGLEIQHPSASTNRYPIPFPTKKVKGGLSKQAIEEIQNAQFEAKAVEPHSSQSGFLFFDVSGISVPLAGANFYLTGVRDSKGSELMYFEIPLEKYLSAPGH